MDVCVGEVMYACILMEAKNTTCAKEVLVIFQSDSTDSFNLFKKLAIQKRTPDSWYSSFLDECREGVGEEMSKRIENQENEATETHVFCYFWVTMNLNDTTASLLSTTADLTCPQCGYSSKEKIPKDD